jgi:predicted MFS family arabinose efflux permease
LARRLGPGRLLRGGAVLLAAASLACAAAPPLTVLALCQVPLGGAGAALMGTATSAAGDWADAPARGRVLGWTLMGSPAAWIVGTPALGLLGALSWRIGWIALPLAASLAALVVLPAPARRDAPGADGGGLRAALGDPPLRRWLAGELAANSAWLGLLVYAGALFTESYDCSTVAVGAALALAAVAFALGNLVFRRWVAGVSAAPLVRLALAMALLTAIFGACRPAPAVSAALLAAASFLGGGRSLLGNAYGLAAAPERRLAAMAARAAANQFGAFIGAAAAGAALSAGGYRLLGLVLALGFVLSTLPLSRPRRARTMLPARRRRSEALARAR